MDDEISINLFCHSLGLWLRLLLRLVKVLLEFGLSGLQWFPISVWTEFGTCNSASKGLQSYPPTSGGTVLRGYSIHFRGEANSNQLINCHRILLPVFVS